MEKVADHVRKVHKVQTRTDTIETFIKGNIRQK
jgi:hypothetical protein